MLIVQGIMARGPTIRPISRTRKLLTETKDDEAYAEKERKHTDYLAVLSEMCWLAGTLVGHSIPSLP